MLIIRKSWSTRFSAWRLLSLHTLYPSSWILVWWRETDLQQAVADIIKIRRKPGLLLERLSNLLRKSNVTLSTMLATREKPFWVRLMLQISNSFQVAPAFHCCHWHPKIHFNGMIYHLQKTPCSCLISV